MLIAELHQHVIDSFTNFPLPCDDGIDPENTVKQQNVAVTLNK